MLLYALTIFLSAFLLFQVQPLIAKIILPWFGGSAAVWSAAMLFFQLTLLAGYGYAHFVIAKLKAKMQVRVHAALLVIACLLLPILPNPYWKPTEAGDPTVRILILLAATIGLPYFLLSSTSPLLQAWYVRKTGSGVPYRLFALSNFGSMLALVSFPFLIEPTLTSRQQAWSWSGGFIAFALLCIVTAWKSQDEAAPAAATTESSVVATGPAPKPKFGELVLWVSLAACASMLLVSITNHLSQNVAPIPLLWVLPLALYLLSFILCFESDKIYQRWLFIPVLAGMLGWMAYLLFANSGNVHIRTVIPAFAFGLFMVCMMCHGELAKRRPAPEHLTLFYLMVSLGGAVGGMIVAFIAPRFFRAYWELPLGMVACAGLAVLVLWDVMMPKWGQRILNSILSAAIGAGAGYYFLRNHEFGAQWQYWASLGGCALAGVALLWKLLNDDETSSWTLRVATCVGLGVLAGYLGRHEYDDEKGYRLIVRNFYGVLRVADEDASEEYALRNLTHGTINHGSQLLNEAQKYTTTSYYGPGSGIGRAIHAAQAKGPARIGMIGLGAGVSSNYGRAGDYVRIYEINPLVPTISGPNGSQFTFFSHSPADKGIFMGDARLVIEQQLKNKEVQQFDVLGVDAFSSDAIPIHLLTKEALGLYFQHLKPNGVLALHISNRYLDLEPVCTAGAQAYGMAARTVSDQAIEGPYLSSSTWVLLTKDANWFKEPAFGGADMTESKSQANFRPWTDDYSNIVQILRLE